MALSQVWTNNDANSQRSKASISIASSTTSSYDHSSVICKISPKQEASYSVDTVLAAKGYMPLYQVDRSLQGCVVKVSRKKTTNIIKITNKHLHDKNVIVVNGQEVKIRSNILKEMQILKYLTVHHPPSSLAKFEDFFEDNDHFFLVMEDAGTDLFDLVKDCHQLLEDGLLSLSVWHSFCRTAVQQMVSVIEWLHNTMHCCHLDISLENFAISNVQMITNKNTVNFNADFQIKLIDFGLAEVFSDNFHCSKFVGKPFYKSPKVFGKRTFGARSSDCWSLGICFFMMIVGYPPFTTPSVDDQIFTLLMHGEYVHVLTAWNRIHYVTPHMLDLMKKIFVKEKYRLNIKEIQSHPYFMK